MAAGPPANYNYDDGYDNVPLEYKRPFGAGLKRKRSVAFVRASDPKLHTIPSTIENPDASSISEQYLSLVMKAPGKDSGDTATAPNTAGEQEALSAGQGQQAAAPRPLCPVCNVSLEDDTFDSVRKHEASIPHQVALAHSHPPSAIDRSRMGLSYLSSFGWDPDSRRGLGAAGQGMRDPIKVRPKEDKLGLGVVIPDEFVEKAKEPKPKKLTVADLRRREAEDRQKGERLRELFYRSDDVLRHLGKEL